MPTLSAVERLKLAVAQSGGPMQTVPVEMTVSYAPETMTADATVIASTDPRIRLLGGRWARIASPWDSYISPQALTGSNNDAPRNVVSGDRWGMNYGIEFVLPAGQTQFEIAATESGTRDELAIRIDGRATNPRGFQLNLQGTSAMRFIRFRLPPSSSPRTITLDLTTSMFGGLRLPAGDTLAPLPAEAANYATVVFEGDSITEGAVATSQLRTWIAQASIELGIRNPINVGQGSSGYLARRQPYGRPIPARIDDVVQALNGGPPDAVVVAAGINDCMSFPQADIAAAALDYFRALRARAPDMTIIVLGPFNGRNDSYPTGLATCRDLIFASGRQVPGVHLVDVADWVNAANKDVVFGPADNGPHPVDAGHAIYGAKAAAAIRRIIEGL